MKMQCSSLDRSGEELSTASNFCIWSNIVPKCGCTSKTPVVTETTVVFNKTWQIDAVNVGNGS
jgi:hypothetical protein